MTQRPLLDPEVPRLHRAPVAPSAAAALSFAATVAVGALLLPVFEGAETELYSNTVPRRAVLPLPLVAAPLAPRSFVGAHSAPGALPPSGSPPEPPTASGLGRSPRGIAGLALGAVVATVLTMYNRLRFRSSSPQNLSSPVAAASTSAVLDPPQAPSGLVYNKGIVSPEEGVDLPFTLTELRDAIPQDCFEKSLAWSMFYFARDWAIVGLLYYFHSTFFALGVLGKIAWWNAVGFYGWCLFVVGHDCGHGTFSNFGWLNQLLGHICHAPLCVPFNGWRISHRAHHQFHNDVDRDHSWRPSVATSVAKLPRALQGLRFSPLILLVYPFYLLSPSHENGFSGCHFWPWNSLFKPEERVGVACSALSVVGWLGLIAAATAQWGFWTVFQLYWVPYLIFVCWLDLVTLMQHTDRNALFFRGKTWNYLRGALSTIDRTYRHLIDPFNLGYGRIIDHLHHNISDGHVVHHIFFTQIPHYRLIAATEAIKPVLGKHYRFDDTPIYTAFGETMDGCWFVDDVADGVVTYKGRQEYREWERQQQLRDLA